MDNNKKTFIDGTIRDWIKYQQQNNVGRLEFTQEGAEFVLATFQLHVFFGKHDKPQVKDLVVLTK